MTGTKGLIYVPWCPTYVDRATPGAHLWALRFVPAQTQWQKRYSPNTPCRMSRKSGLPRNIQPENERLHQGNSRTLRIHRTRQIHILPVWIPLRRSTSEMGSALNPRGPHRPHRPCRLVDRIFGREEQC